MYVSLFFSLFFNSLGYKCFLTSTSAQVNVLLSKYLNAATYAKEMLLRRKTEPALTGNLSTTTTIPSSVSSSHIQEGGVAKSVREEGNKPRRHNNSYSSSSTTNPRLPHPSSPNIPMGEKGQRRSISTELSDCTTASSGSNSDQNTIVEEQEKTNDSSGCSVV